MLWALNASGGMSSDFRTLKTVLCRWEIISPMAIGWRIHCGVEVTEVTELSTNKQHTLSLEVLGHNGLQRDDGAFYLFLQKQKIALKPYTSPLGTSRDDDAFYLFLQKQKPIVCFSLSIAFSIAIHLSSRFAIFFSVSDARPWD
jgi:hypothetical protein